MEGRRGRPGEPDEKTAEAAAAPARTDRLTLLALGNGTVVTHPLPEKGPIVIGRGESADVRVAEASISRRHALVTIDAGTLLIEDLGSANGTKVRDQVLAAHQRVTFAPGDLIELGSMMFVVQRPPHLTQPRHVWNHGYFEGRLEEECARAARFDVGLAVIRLHGEDRAKDGELRAVLASLTESSDVFAADGPCEFEALLVGGPEVGKRVVDVVRRLEDELRARSIDVTLGSATYPRDGRDPVSLLAVANAQVRGTVVRASGGPMVVRDPRMQQLHRLLERVATGTINVLLLGETGVGKEVMAARVHAFSPRARGPFVALNCAALSETLLESELFGHERGAFTGAIAAKKGLLEMAEGGTVFLDELGELPMTLQVKLLRVLEERAVRRVGGLKAIPIDVRLVSATNRDLEAEVSAGRFRQDLYFRLNGVSLVIPPLRERTGEIEELARTFVLEAAEREKRSPAPVIAPAAFALLRGYAWPGNVRELRNIIERAVLLCNDQTILPEHLPVEKMQATVAIEASPATFAPPLANAASAASAARPRGDSIPPVVARRSTMPPPGSAPFSLKSAVDDFERQRILDALESCAGNQSRAAKMLDISRNTLILRLKTYGIKRPRAPRDEGTPDSGGGDPDE